MQLWKRTRNEEGKSQLQQVQWAQRHYDPHRKQLLLLPGQEITDIYPEKFTDQEMFEAKLKDLSGTIKGGEILLGGEGVRDLGIDIYCYSYGRDLRYHQPRPKEMMMGHYAAPERYCGDEAKEFVNDVLLPLLNENGTRGKLEQTLSVEEMCTRLSHVTFVGYSQGGAFLRMVSNAFREKLSQQGYATEEIAQIVPALMGVSVASIGRVDELGNSANMTLFSFRATNDETAKRVVQHYGSALSESKQKAQQRAHMLETGADFVLDEDAVNKDVHVLLKQCGYYDAPSKGTKVRPVSNGVAIRTELPDALEWTECQHGFCEMKFVDREISVEKDGMHVDHNFRLHSIPGTKNPEYPRMLRNTVLGLVKRDAPIICADENRAPCIALLTSRQDSLVRPPLVDYREHEKMPHTTRQGILNATKSMEERGIG